jgi:hypothetical protein
MSHLLQGAANVVQKIGEVAHNYHETEMELRNRRENGFDIDMPDVKRTRADDGRPTVMQDLLSYLGSTFNPKLSNPFQAKKLCSM